MSDEQHAFKNTPFANLSLTIATDKRAKRTEGRAGKGGKVPGGRAHSRQEEDAAAQARDAADTALFLQAMEEGVRPRNQGRGFALRDQEGFAALQEHRAQPATDTPPPAHAAAPVTPPAPEAKARQRPATGNAAHGHKQDARNFARFLEERAEQGEEKPAPHTLHGAAHTPQEDDAFLHAMSGVTPLAGKGRDMPAPRDPAPGPEGAALSMQEIMEGKFEFNLSLTGEYMEGYVLGLDEPTMNKLRAGQFSPEAHLDLHGLNAMQAYQALVGFFRSAWFKGLRTLLVVPGRGRNSPDGIGVLRDRLQLWLTQEPFKRVVLAFCTARPSDGGFGGVYVLLRKMRKKGKIQWERMPADPDLF